MARHGAERIDRKSLRGPDEFIVSVRRFLGWSASHRRTLVVVASGAAVVALAVLLVGWNSARRNRQAAEGFRVAHAAFQKGDLQGATRSFADLERNYAGTAFGGLATLYRGHAEREAGNTALALEAYRAALEGAPEGSDLRQIVLMSLARLEEVTAGGSEAALGHYEAAASIDGPERPEALLGAARVLRALERPAEARAVYERLLEVTTADTRAFVEAQLALLPQAS